MTAEDKTNANKKVDLKKLACHAQHPELKTMFWQALYEDREIGKLEKNPCLAVKDGCKKSHNGYLSMAIGILVVDIILGIIFWSLFSLLRACPFAVLAIIGLLALRTVHRNEKRDAHKQEYEAEMAELLHDSFWKYLSEQVNLRRKKLAIFQRLRELFALQLQAYGEPANLSQKEDAHLEPYRGSYEDPHAQVEPARLPPELTRLGEIYVEYFSAQEQELHALCKEYLPRIADLQEKAQSEDASVEVRKVAKQGAKHLEAEFFHKVQAVINGMDVALAECAAKLSGLFTGKDNKTFAEDIQKSRAIVNDLAGSLHKPAISPPALPPANDDVSSDKPSSADPQHW